MLTSEARKVWGAAVDINSSTRSSVVAKLYMSPARRSCKAYECVQMHMFIPTNRYICVRASACVCVCNLWICLFLREYECVNMCVIV